MSHYIERWECGHVASQCRCPGPKEERTRPGKCSTCAAQVSAMPERVEQPTVDEIQAGTAYITADPVAHKVCNWMIAFGRQEAESRLLAAEARVREVEAEMNVMRQEVQFAHELAEDKAIATRAERDALVPVARLGLWTLDVLAKGKDGVIWNTIDFDGGDVELAAWGFNVLEGVPLHPEQGEWPQTSGETAATTQARAILAREAGE